jgi:hypothetical protein
MKKTFSIAFLAIACALFAHGQATVTGSVRFGDVNRPAPGVQVMINGTPTEKLPAPGYMAETRADGGFSVANVAPGVYRVCVYRIGDYLNPCEWDDSYLPNANVLVVTAGNNRNNLSLELKRGERVFLRLKDPNLQLRNQQFGPAGPHIQVLLADASGRRVWSASRTAPGEYESLIDPAAGMAFRIVSDDLLLERPDRSRVAPTDRIPPIIRPIEKRPENLPNMGAFARMLRSGGTTVVINISGKK